MIAGSLRADNGKIFFHGKEVATEDKKTRQRVGICPQSLVYWKLLTCKEQLVFMGNVYGLDKNTSESRSLALLEQLGLEGKKMKSLLTYLEECKEDSIYYSLSCMTLKF
jgi:ABC-2 type transport system ATP-binding protein